MPNYITNKLRFVGDEKDVKDILNFIKIDDGEVSGVGTIDFNKITPMPKWIYGNSPDITGISMEDEEKYGQENTSLGWARKNWGTKWNAFGQPDERNTEDTIYFETAWNGIPNLIQKLAWIFPNVIIYYAWCGEDFGCNSGQYIFKGTEILNKFIPKNCSREAYEFAMEMAKTTPEENHLRFNNKTHNYEYIDE